MPNKTSALRSHEPLLYDELVRRQKNVQQHLEKQKIHDWDTLVKKYEHKDPRFVSTILAAAQKFSSAADAVEKDASATEKILQGIALSHYNNRLDGLVNMHTKAVDGDVEAVFDLSEYYFHGSDFPADPFFAFRLVRYAAEQGLQRAYSILGKCYARGFGTAPNPEEALQWFLKLDEDMQRDDLEILTFIALCYYEGIGFSKDENKAHDLWIDAAEHGHPDGFRFCSAAANAGYPRGQYMLGIMYQLGRGVPADIQQALYWFLKAADHGYAYAQCRLGILYSEGNYGIEKDLETAVQWFQLAAAQNDPAAKGHLAACLAMGAGIEQNQPEAERIWRELAKDDPSNAVHPKGNSACQYELAKLLLDKEYANYHPKDGITYLRKAAAQDNPVAQTHLGIYFYNGSFPEVVKQNIKEARSLFHKAAKKDDMLAQYYLGEIYADGTGVPANRKEAFQWFRKSAEQGYVPAQQKLAHYYLNGIGTKKDEDSGYLMLTSLALWGDEEALTLLRSAALSGNAAAEYAMFLYCREKNDRPEADKWFEKALAQENPRALCIMAIKSESSGNEEESRQFYRRAAQRGDAEAQTRLALILCKLDDPDAPENQEAFGLLRQAAEQEHPAAHYLLGNFYRDGIGIKADPKKAFEYYTESASLGDPSGVEQLAACFEHGIGIKRDEDTAFQLYTRAANMGHPQGQLNLGLCYLRGTGCVRDMELAFKWLSRAADSGHPAVIPVLERLGLDVAKLSGGYKQFRQSQSAAQGDLFGSNFEKIFDTGNKPIKPTPPEKSSGK